jgi:hypothetical protein
MNSRRLIAIRITASLTQFASTAQAAYSYSIDEFTIIRNGALWFQDRLGAASLVTLATLLTSANSNLTSGLKTSHIFNETRFA